MEKVRVLEGVGKVSSAIEMWLGPWGERKGKVW